MAAKAAVVETRKHDHGHGSEWRKVSLPMPATQEVTAWREPAQALRQTG